MLSSQPAAGGRCCSGGSWQASEGSGVPLVVTPFFASVFSQSLHPKGAPTFSKAF